MTLNDSDWWLFLSTLAGAIVGSLSAGAITFVMARQANAEAELAAQRTRTHDEKAQAFRVFVKLAKISSNLGAVHHYIEQAIAAKEQQGIHSPICAQMEAVAGAYPRMYFTAEDLAILAAMEEYELLDLLMVIDDNHNTVMDGVDTYSKRRLQFADQFGEPPSDGPKSPKLTPEQILVAGPKIEELNGLASLVRSIARQYFTEAVTLTDRIGPSFRKYFADGNFLLVAQRKADERNAYYFGRRPG